MNAHLLKLVALAATMGAAAGLVTFGLTAAFAPAYEAIEQGVAMTRGRGGPFMLQLLGAAAVGWIGARIKWSMSAVSGRYVEAGILVVAGAVLAAVSLGLAAQSSGFPTSLVPSIAVLAFIGLCSGYLTGVYQASKV